MSRTDLSLTANGEVTLYVGGKKVLRGTLDQIAAHLGANPPAPPAPRKERQLSRSARWAAAASAASTALGELLDVQQEYQDWLDNLPENLQSSALGEKLQAVCDLDVQGAVDVIDDAEGADLPMGFGRD